MNRLGVDRIAELLEMARDVRVLVVGDVMLDRYISGRVARISPEAPVPVVHVEEDSSAVGGAANVAANVVALGAGCAVVGCVGDDEAGRELRGELAELGVDLDGLVAAPQRPTTVKTRVMARHQQVVRVDREQVGDIDEETADRLAEAARRLLSACSAVAIQDYNKGVLVPSVVTAVVTAAAESDIPSVVDPKRQRFFEYPGVTVFKPNAKELEDALGEALRPDDGTWMEAVRERLACHHLLLTLGEQGMALHSGGSRDSTPADLGALGVRRFRSRGHGDGGSRRVSGGRRDGAGICYLGQPRGGPRGGEGGCGDGDPVRDPRSRRGDPRRVNETV